MTANSKHFQFLLRPIRKPKLPGLQCPLVSLWSISFAWHLRSCHIAQHRSLTAVFLQRFRSGAAALGERSGAGRAVLGTAAARQGPAF